MVTLDSLSVILVTGLITFIITEWLTPLPSAAVAVITTCPTVTPVTLPFWSTMATLVLLENQITFLLVAVSVPTFAVRLTDSDTLRNSGLSIISIEETYSFEEKLRTSLLEKLFTIPQKN